MTLTVPDFSALRVLVAGDAMLDEYWFGETARLSPEAPVPVVRTETTEQRAGGAANVALNVAALGAAVDLVAIVGADERGRMLEAALVAHGVGCELVRSDELPTIHKLRVLARNQQLIRLDAERSLAAGAAGIVPLFESAAARADVVVLSDYGKGTLGEVTRLIAACRAAGRPVFVDPKGADFSRYRGATMLTPNQSELEAVVGAWADDDELVAKAERVRADLELDSLLVTRGERGMLLVRDDGEPIRLPAEAREVFDVTGAGDTVLALIASAYAAGLPLEHAAALANLGAGLVVGKIGVATLSRSELSLALHRRGSGGRGLVTLDELADLVAEAKQRRERVVMTNGCFDILHAGHVAYLEEARSLGDRLVVAINDDESVRRLKGAPRPLTPLGDRMAVLAGLAAVDWVVPFAEDTPAEVVRRVLPDVLVKGGDYTRDEIVGADIVEQHGGDVRVLAFKHGRSTSALIEAIRRPD